MRRFCLWLGLFFAGTALGQARIGSGERIQINDLALTVPDGWVLAQNAKDGTTIILGFQHGGEYLSLVAKSETGMNMRDIFVNGSRVVRDTYRLPRNSIDWQVIETEKTTSAKGTVNSVGFLVEINGATYFGHARSATNSRSIAIANEFLTAFEMGGAQ